MQEDLRKYSAYLSLGIEIAGAMIIPVLAGVYADKYFGTRPWLSLTGALMGIIGVFWNIYKLAVMANEETKQRKSKKKNGSPN